jgi:hypothetical protein
MYLSISVIYRLRFDWLTARVLPYTTLSALKGQDLWKKHPDFFSSVIWATCGCYVCHTPEWVETYAVIFLSDSFQKYEIRNKP